MQLPTYSLILLRTVLTGLFFLFLTPADSYSQSEEEDVSLFVREITEPIKVDGKLDEAIWKEAEIVNTFWQYFPYDTANAVANSEVKMAYDKNFMYVAFYCKDPTENRKYVTLSLRRDYRGPQNDGITIIVDPFQDQTNGILFGVTPYGVQREALISGNSGSGGGGSGGGFDLSWDNKWFAEAQRYEGYWTAEMAIPFKTLRYKGGAQEWRANFYRIESQLPERSTWGHNPRNMSLLSLAYGGKLKFENPLPNPGANVSLIPYVAGGFSKDYEADENGRSTFDVGGDAKIGITPSLNLDLTLNPDFSQVEVDVQQTNLTRFELFFPERRQFFLENADLFASFGTPRLRPFFSRRIGIAEDPSTGLNVPNAISYGARLSGRIDKNWRIGVMNMQTAKDREITQPGYNYSVLALQRQVFTRSNISVIAMNRQATNRVALDSTLEAGIDSENYSRLLGVDYNLASADNVWNGKVFYHRSFSPGDNVNEDAFSHGASISYNKPAINLSWEHQIVGDNYDPQTGFAPRTGYTRFNPEVSFRFYPNKKIANHGPGISYSYIRTNALGKTDHNISLFYRISFGNTAEFRASLENDYVYLFSDFDPTRSGEGEALKEGTDYNYYSLNFRYQSDSRPAFYYTIRGRIGQFYNGNLNRLSGNINYRFQPFGIASLNFTYNNLQLPGDFADGDFWLLGPRFDITFTRKLFLTTFFQYNNQLDNININARLQYRFKPVSDFFLVYTDNYFPENFKVKNRALVAKLTYWLNL